MSGGFAAPRLTTDERRPAAGSVRGSARELAEASDFTTFVEANYARLLHMADLLTGDHGRAEDLLQTVLVRACQRWSTVRQDNPLGYVRAAIVNARTDWWRRGSLREQPLADPPDPPAAPDHSGQVVGRDAVLRALAVLTPRERAVVVLRFYEDLTEAEIARTLGIAPGTVKSTCSRALGKLRISPELDAPSRKDSREDHR